MVEQVTHPDGARVVIEMWSDLGCPWCYVAKHRLRTAIERRPDADRFKVVMRSFELNPAAPKQPEMIEEAFIRTHGGTSAHFTAAERRIQAIAREEGLELFSAVQDGFFAGALDPYAPDALAGVAESVGLDGRKVRAIFASGEYADRVRADRAEGMELGATGAPFVVLDRRVAAPGAQQVPVYGRLLERVAGPVPSERTALTR